MNLVWIASVPVFLALSPASLWLTHLAIKRFGKLKGLPWAWWDWRIRLTLFNHFPVVYCLYSISDFIFWVSYLILLVSVFILWNQPFSIWIEHLLCDWCWAGHFIYSVALQDMLTPIQFPGSLYWGAFNELIDEFQWMFHFTEWINLDSVSQSYYLKNGFYLFGLAVRYLLCDTSLPVLSDLILD